MMQSLSPSQLPDTNRSTLSDRFRATRALTEQICAPLENEDYTVQPSPEVSPPKWHLGHTTWFFEEMLLKRFVPGYQRQRQEYGLIYNSYYKGAGRHWIQAERGQLSRPTVQEVIDYRHRIDEQVLELLIDPHANEELLAIVELGLHHEQQHQELLYMDIKYILGANPSSPAYTRQPVPPSPVPGKGWRAFSEGIYEIGHGSNSFAYDNEKPRHKTYLYPFAICESLVSNGDYLEFMEDSGYERPEFWLSKGYDFINDNQVSAPLYWSKQDGEWHEYSLYGLHALDLNAPVTHISYFEASAFAAWKGLRLPTEQEFEVALSDKAIPADQSTPALQPINANAGSQVWCWTSSHYSPYPGYRTFDGPLQEYNGKFMCNQFVLRGGCVATPHGHLRQTYRNFYEPHQRWMFSGVRLAQDEE